MTDEEASRVEETGRNAAIAAHGAMRDSILKSGVDSGEKVISLLTAASMLYQSVLTVARAMPVELRQSALAMFDHIVTPQAELLRESGDEAAAD